MKHPQPNNLWRVRTSWQATDVEVDLAVCACGLFSPLLPKLCFQSCEVDVPHMQAFRSQAE